MTIKFKELSDNIGYKVPFGGYQLYHPLYKDMPIEDIIKHSDISNRFIPYGYKVFYLVRSERTLHCFK